MTEESLRSSLVINRGIDLIGMVCDVHSTKFVKCLPHIWLGADDRMMNKTEAPLSGYRQSETVLQNRPGFLFVVTDGQEIPVTWPEERYWGLNTSWDSVLFLTDAMTISASLLECMRIYTQKCQNTQAQAISSYLSVTTWKMYSSRNCQYMIEKDMVSSSKGGCRVSDTQEIWQGGRS